jgi:nicotinamide-nucleotide amidase
VTDLAERLVADCREHSVTIGTAESLTGGLLAAEIAGVPGCSAVFRGSVVAYHLEVKRSLLRVPHELLAHVVSADVAKAMASGAQEALGVDLALATTGVAGPDALDDQVPGTVWIATALRAQPPQAFRFTFSGSREEIRWAAVQAALQAGLDLLEV